jgi:hypothetical protein
MGGAENNVACCAICGQEIEVGDLVVSTTTGDCVHVACADREATQAYHRRTWLALVTAALFITLVLLLTALQVRMYATIGSAAAMAVLHGVWHRRWWHFTVLRLYRRWRYQR